MRITHWFGRSLAAFVAFGSAAFAAQPAQIASAPARPALWKLADADTIIYLFGTIHLLPEGQKWRSPALDAALNRSDELVLEIANLDDPMAAATEMARLGMSPGLPPIVERVPEAKRAALKGMIAESGYPEAVFDRLETWAAAFPLLGVTFKRLGLDPSYGVERQIGAPFRAAGKTVKGLETIEQQLGFFDTLSEDAQRAFLEAVLEDPGDTKGQFAAMFDAWKRGDVAAIAQSFNADVAMSPELRERLLKQRNARWADTLAGRLQRPGTVFVAVGAGHLAGPDSVQEMLRARGFKATRVQ